MISDVKLSHYFPLSKVKKMFSIHKSFRKHYQSMKQNQILSQKQSVTYQNRCAFKNFTIFTWKHRCRSLSLIKLQGWRSETLLKRNSNTGVFLWKLQKCFGKPFLQNTSGGCFGLCDVGKPLQLNTLRCKPPEVWYVLWMDSATNISFVEVVFCNYSISK